MNHTVNSYFVCSVFTRIVFRYYVIICFLCYEIPLNLDGVLTFDRYHEFFLLLIIAALVSSFSDFTVRVMLQFFM